MEDEHTYIIDKHKELIIREEVSPDDLEVRVLNKDSLV